MTPTEPPSDQSERPLTTPAMWRAFWWAWNEWYYGPRRTGVDRTAFAVEHMLGSDERVCDAIRAALGRKH